MTKKSNLNRIYDLEERTFSRLIGTKSVRFFVKKLPRTIANIEDGKQLIKSSGSVPIYRDYIEANESLSKKDFVFRIKICRKEAKESAYFIRLIKETNPKELENESLSLYNEAIELKKIFLPR